MFREFIKNYGLRLNVFGDMTYMSPSLRSLMAQAVLMSRDNTQYVIQDMLHHIQNTVELVLVLHVEKRDQQIGDVDKGWCQGW